MPTIQQIRLQNFKGVSDVTIEMSQKIDSPVVTLIGLNESGKTTILEGLSHFVSGDTALKGMFEGIHSRVDATSLIPLHRKAAFTGSIRIEGIVQLDGSDFARAAKIALEEGLVLAEHSFPTKLKITQTYLFEDSVLKKQDRTWDFPTLRVRTSKGTRERDYVRPGPEEDRTDIWGKITAEVWSNLPSIAYFPTFLVDMPARIYLKEHKDERPVNRYYRLVFEDILRSLDEGLSLEKHVCKRIEDFRESERSPNWFSIFFGGASRAPIDSVFQKISNAVTREVLGSWKRVFQRPIAAKSISVEWNVDTEKDNMPYASFVVSDGESRYAISERSLGFRWFFSFLLFTAFKQKAQRSTLFVFDEPAANLHAKAQAELLTSFSRIVAAGNRIVYSTHSHHMINTKWLSGAYIVENTALDYDSDDAFGLVTKPTNIVATRYRSFVSQYPSRTSYFQPVIEKLEYVTPEIVGDAPFVIVEGISDYYALKLAAAKGGQSCPFSLMPGTGSGASGPLISLLMGRGDKFLVLLDDDKAGKIAAKRYKDEWYLSADQVRTLGELDAEFKGLKLEGLISQETKSLIKQYSGQQRSPSKKEIGLYFAEMLSLERADCLSPKTQQTLEKILAMAAILVRSEGTEEPMA